MFGPAMSFWTGRFESKHRTAKSIALSAKNVINITKTISERQQLRCASVFYHGIFDFMPFTLPEKVSCKADITEQNAFNVTLKSFMGDKDLLCENVMINGQLYKSGDIVVVSVTDCDNISVGFIQSILVKAEKVYFVVQKYDAVRSFMRYFESSLTSDPMSVFIESSKIADYKPLIKRGTSSRFVFFFHHHVSYQYE